MSNIEIGICHWCGKEGGGIHEVYTPDGVHHGDCCTDCYHQVHAAIEAYFYYGEPYPTPKFKE